ncbi:MAG: diacylglycerol kinase [Gammaproteobacteria bacterium]|nr:diacylglycerol kinase [Gammaproteobacteria bacterium]MCI0590417.1 diacylglycerol kinase [Gammaproteobacteria bacterium]
MSENSKRGKTGLTRLWNASLYSLSGLRSAYKYESAFRQECLLAVALVMGAVFTPVSMAERALMISSVAIVLMVELLNSAIESAVDRVSIEDHQLSKRAKDMGSAAVLIALVNVVLVWLLVLIGL